jgi:hypothetical protein
MQIVASAIIMRMVFLMFLPVLNEMYYDPVVETQTGKLFDNLNIAFTTNTHENKS